MATPFEYIDEMKKKSLNGREEIEKYCEMLKREREERIYFKRGINSHFKIN